MIATAAATPGFWDWSFDPPLVLVIDLAIFYRLGSRRTVTPERKRRAQRVRDLCFYSSLIVLAVALASPIEKLSAQLFWVHMIQHVLLIVVAAPLFVAACPWIRLWRCLPLGARRTLARWLSHGDGAAPLRAIGRGLGRPAASFVVFSVVLLGWHVPGMFDATLESAALHAFEHTLFFCTAVLFWKQVIPSAPLHTRLTAPERVVFLIGGMIVGWALAVVLALAPDPLYGYYAHETIRPDGISALADQHLAAGIMWVPGSVTFLIVLFVYVHRWLQPAGPDSPRAPRLAGEH